MWKALKNAFKIPELRDRIVFTLLMLIVFRLGIYIPVPGIDLKAWGAAFTQLGSGTAGGLLSFYDVFTGGAFKSFSIYSIPSSVNITDFFCSSIVKCLSFTSFLAI